MYLWLYNQRILLFYLYNYIILILSFIEFLLCVRTFFLLVHHLLPNNATLLSRSVPAPCHFPSGSLLQLPQAWIRYLHSQSSLYFFLPAAKCITPYWNFLCDCRSPQREYKLHEGCAITFLLQFLAHSRCSMNIN